jgi:hypothetical protein
MEFQHIVQYLQAMTICNSVDHIALASTYVILHTILCTKFMDIMTALIYHIQNAYVQKS